MSWDGELEHAYSEWRRLAEAEGKAIRAGDWRFVADCQKALSQLQPVITRLTDQVREKNSALRSQAPSCKANTQATILNLMALQQGNLASLEQRRQRLSEHIQQLARTGRNLRGIQRSYSSPRPSAWNSYS